jgi:acyl dehydratase
MEIKYEDKYTEINVNDEAEIYHTITSGDVESFVRLTGDDNPLHVDDAFAAHTMLKQRIVHGMLTASFISTLIGTKLPGRGALWYEQHIRFIEPVHIGEKIRIWARVKQKSAALRVLVLDVAIFNDKGIRVVECEARVKVVKQERMEGGSNA